tara:strand:+ start:2669 stop:3970 length:1302 start_codon:yes stop_codon:yes gene_type:complete
MGLFSGNFFEGFVGGLAESLDDRLKDDMRRTDERAERVAKERMSLRDAQKKQDAEFERTMTEYAEGIQSTLGPNATAVDAIRVINEYGGNLAGAERAYKLFTESSDAGIDVGTLVTHTQGEDIGTMEELVRSLNPYTASMRKLQSGEIMGTGFLKNVDLTTQINKDVGVSESAPVRKFDIGTATVDRAGLKTGQEFAKSMRGNEKKPSTYIAMHVGYTQQLEDERAKGNAANPEIIASLIAKRNRAHDEWLKFQLDERNARGAGDEPLGPLDKDLTSSITTILKTTRETAISKFAVKGLDGKIGQVIAGNEGEAFDLERAAYQSLKSRYEGEQYKLLHANADEEVKQVNLQISNFKNKAEEQYNRVQATSRGAPVSYTKFVDLSPTGLMTADDVLARARKGEFSRNAVIKIRTTNTEGQEGFAKLIWTGYKLI